jgi:hypothetical protein
MFALLFIRETRNTRLEGLDGPGALRRGKDVSWKKAIKYCLSAVGRVLLTGGWRIRR